MKNNKVFAYLLPLITISCTDADIEAINQLATAYNQSVIVTPPAPYYNTPSPTYNYDYNYGGGTASCDECVVSDARLKKNLIATGQTYRGHRLYSFEYIDQLAIRGTFVGVVAQDLIGTADERFVFIRPNGTLVVDYKGLGLPVMSAKSFNQRAVLADL